MSAVTRAYSCAHTSNYIGALDHPPVKVIVVVLCLSPEVQKHQRQAESPHEQSRADAFHLSDTKNHTKCCSFKKPFDIQHDFYCLAFKVIRDRMEGGRGSQTS